ncbi:MAG: serine/threonine-protein kinase [Acidimicrobiales bacterium]
MAVSSSSATSVIAGRYRVEGPLGRGGMSEVRAGTDLRLQRPIAVKFLLPEMAARDDIRPRFEAEARAAASLSDPHAVAVYDTGEHEGQPYIVMERLPGETLGDRIAAGPVDPDWLRRVAVEVLGALAAAHKVGLVHRDVKPGNILLTADNHAKIADFGIAKSLEGSSGSRDLTGTGQLLGTPAYLPPERLDGAPATAKSDLYSLGVVLYEALSGRRPFPGDTPLAAARAIMAGEFPPLREIRPGLDPALVTTVERAMATDPARRFDSAGAMAAALSAQTVTAAGAPTLVDGAGAPATSVLDRRDLSDTMVGAPVPLPAPPPLAGVGVPSAKPRFRVPLALLVVLVFIAVLVAGLNRGDRSPSNEPAGAQNPSTTAPSSSGATSATTAAPASTAALAAELRAAAGRLSPSDGARAADLASSLRQVADQVQAGNGGGAATGAIVSVGAWRLTGQLSDAAATSAINLLSRVPGVTVVTLPSLSTAPAPGRAKPDDRGKGKDD